MKNSFILLFLLMIFLFSCSSKKDTTKDRCNGLLKTDYKNITIEKTPSIIEDDTLFINEVKFECMFSAMYTQKVMYDTFGDWQKEIFQNRDQIHPMLVWENIKPFENDKKEFTIAARGVEAHHFIYSSAMVFDDTGNDMLSENSKYRDTLISYFGNLLRNNDLEKRDFYEKYWTMADPDTWKYIQEHRSKNKD